MHRRLRLLILMGIAWSVLVAPASALAQQTTYDPSWYNANRPHVKIAIANNGVYAVTGQDLAAAGVPVSTIDPSTLRLLENGREVPLYYEGRKTAMRSADRLVFIGRRNRGTDEQWAYGYDASKQSSSFRSLYTDTTYYWLTWGGAPGPRYETDPSPGPQPGNEARSAARDTLHLEEDRFYFYGDSYQAGDPRYTRGEGYYWKRLTGEATWTHDVALNGLRSTDAPLHLRVRLNSESASQHDVQLAVQTTESDFVPVDTVSWAGYAFQTLRASLPQNTLPADGPLHLRLTSLGNESDVPNRVLVDWIEVSYARDLQAQGGRQHFTIPEADAYNVTFRGYAADTVHVFAPSERRHRAVPVTDGTATFSARPSGATRYWAVGQGRVRTPAAVVKDAPSNLADASHRADHIILTTAALRPSAERLAAYRRSHNEYAVKVVNVQNVFDQFDYGRPTPIAIRRFVMRTQDWQRPPRFLCIWGDAPYPIYTELESRQRPDWAVPSFGFSPSDGWFAMKNPLQPSAPEAWVELLAVGRVTVRTNEEGDLFLQKLTDYEAAPLESWNKRMLLLAGGTTGSEQQRLQEASNAWGRTAAQPPTGMDTLKFYKSSEKALDPSFQDSLNAALRKGAGWLNYFGHSAANTWEIVTSQPSNFDNAGRLPFVVSLGCQTGAFAGGRYTTRNSQSFGERLVIGSLNGSIAHWGASSTGTLIASRRLNDKLIDAVFRDTMRVMGRATQQAKNRFARAGGDITHSLQYNLLGEPAARMALPAQPDLHAAAEDLAITPTSSVPADSQLTVAVRVQNQGLVPRDSFSVRLTHQSPTGSTTRYTQRLAPFRLSKEIAFTVPIDDEAVGENTFRVELDAGRTLTEESETNNIVEKTHLVFSTGVTLVAPQDLGIVLQQRPTLRVSLASAQQVGTPVQFELDTTATFETPVAATTITASQIAAEWQPRSPLDDGRTYFWRARIDVPEAANTWRTSSFTVRTDLVQRGWLQQGALFSRNEQDKNLRRQDSRWAFEKYNIEVFASSERGRGTYKGQFNVNGTRDPSTYRGLGFGVLVINGNTGEIRTSASFCTYDTRESFEADFHCSGLGDEEDAVAALDSLIRSVPDGDYIFTRTRHLARESNVEIADDVKDIFRSLGSRAIDTLNYRDLWLMRTRKGQPEAAEERVADDTNEIATRTDLSFSYPEGHTTSPLIGPARSWEQLNWTAELANDASAVRIDVLPAESDSALLRDLSSGPIDLASINAADHRYLRLRATLTDSSQASTPQLTSWHATYEGVADLALDPSALALSADTLAKGEPLRVSAAVRNLSPSPAEQAMVRFFVTDADNRTTLAHTDTLTNVPPDTTRSLDATLPTSAYVGPNRLRLSVRQPGLPKPTAFNNVLIRPFRVRGDKTPPQYEVTIDGERVPNNPEPVQNLQDPNLPFVAARPTIQVEIEDESAFELLQDTSVVEMRLNDQRVALASPNVQFAPASSDDNTARVTYTPDLSGKDTTYTFKLTVQDASGNEANTYQAHFRVQRDVQVQNLYPYPNPMHTFTRFAFRLRGADAAKVDDFRIRIFTINGRLIREIDLMEEGRLHIGWNAFTWDTRDADGDLVASGVYLYDVHLRANGEPIEVNEGSTVEKLVVVR